MLHPQIDVDPRDRGIKDLIRDGQYQLSDDGQPLDPMEKISNIWPGQPPDDHLHVFVGLPSRSYDTDSDSDDLPWLREVHSRIWNREELRPQLFRDVLVTQSHYDALQERLEEVHPDRDSPRYDGRKFDVQRIKHDILQFFTPAETLSPRLPDNNRVRGVEDVRNRGDDEDEDEDEDVREIQSLFPSSLRFLDLSSLGLKKMLTPRFPSPLYLRQEYKVLSDLINEQPQNGRGSVMVSGQPGTGEFLVSLSDKI